ncbi:MAG: hypothetical protein ACRD1E_06795 [Terriglobales bacterium]
MGAVRQSWGKARQLKPARVRRDAEREFRLALFGADEADREALARAFLPELLDGPERARALRHFDEAPSGRGEVLAVRTPAAQGGGIVVDWRAPEAGFLALLQAHPRHRLALARAFPPLRDPLARQLIQAVAARNAALAAISALPEVIPTPLSLLLALGEFGSDTVLLTGNQIGLCFELAALRGDVVGWGAQAAPIAAILLGAFGWRALARELVSLIPGGAGLAAKAGIAYSGTMAVGHALWRMPKRSTTATAPVARRLLARARQSA